MRRPFTTLLLCGVAAFASSAAFAQTARYSVSAQPLDAALLELARESGRNVVFSPDAVRGLRSAPVAGVNGFESALRTLLARSGLTFEIAADGSATIVAATTRRDVRPAARGALAARDQETTELEEVVVTADRRDSFGADYVQVGTFRNAEILDVPATVNIITRDVLDAQAATSLFDAVRNTAGVSRSETNGSTFDSLLIRGIQVDNRNSYKLNGVLPIVNLASIPLENKDRIEILKGVGALYYGFAPPSGIVNLVTKRADRDVTGLVASINEHGGYDGSIDIGRRFGDAFGLRANVAAGQLENGVDRYEGDRFLFALAADWAITPTLDFNFDVEHHTRDATELGSVTLLPANSPLAPPAAPDVVRLPPIPSNKINLGGTGLGTQSEQTNVLARLNWRPTEWMALTLEGGESDMTRDRLFASIRDYDLRPGPNFGDGTLRVTRTQGQAYRNRHLRTEAAAAVTTGPIEHDLIVGLSVNERFQNGRASTPVTTPQNLFSPIDAVVDAPTVFTESPNRIEDRGVYVFDRATLGDWQVLAGVRFSDYQSRTTSSAGVVTTFDQDGASPSLGLVYRPSEAWSVYATYLEGLEEVSPAPNFSAFPGQVLEPATSEQLEFGAKAEVLTGVVAQVGLFRIERPSAFVDPADNVYKLAGLARFQGVEASLTGEINPEVSVYVSGQYLDAQIARALQPALVGRVPENTPEWTFSAFGEWRPSGIPGLALGAGAFYVGERPVNTLNQAYVDAFTTYSASVSYRFEIQERRMTVQLTGDNISDERYWAGAGGNVLAVGVPRTWKLTWRAEL